jgi:hypothetical protein
MLALATVSGIWGDGGPASASAPQTGNDTRRALLVGIDKYFPLPPGPRAAEPKRRDAVGDLEGAINDVEAMRAVLIARYGFKPQNIHVLRNGDATRDRILGEVRAWLVNAGAAGDTSLFFYAGHGSQVRNSKSAEDDRMDETIVPADANLGRPDIRDKELARFFNDAIDRKINVTAIFDSCHSGSIARGLGKVRVVPPDMQDVADPYTPVRPETRGALILSAAQDFQSAGEMRAADEGDAPHGLFTWALVKTLRSMPANQSADRVFLAIRGLMQSSPRTQEPVLAATDTRRRAPWLGAAGASPAGVVVAVQSVENGSVVLQGGAAAGIRKGAELVPDAASAKRITLRVIEERGLAESRAEVTAGSASDITPGMLFGVSKWAAPPNQALRVWIPQSIPADIARNLKLGEGAIADLVEVSASIERADYVLASRVRSGATEYAWVRPDETAAAPRASTVSLLPPSTDWHARGSDSSLLAARLRDLVLRLSTIRNWLLLESPADAGRFPYHLALKQKASGQLRTDGTTKSTDQYGLVLSLDAAMQTQSVDRRYVYVFTLDQEGKSQLLFPSASAGNVENVLPRPFAQGSPLPAEIQIGEAVLFTIDPGITTFILLTTATALPDPTVLEATGVRGNTRGLGDPLSQLLTQGGAGRRGVTLTTPANWSIERITFLSEK